MAKEKFDRSKPHVNVGTIGHIDHGKTTLTAALTKVAADKGWAKFVPYDEVAKASGVAGAAGRDEDPDDCDVARGVCDGEPALRARGLPGARRLHQEHDHGGGADGRRDPGGEAVDGPMPQTREHVLLARQVDVPYLVVALNKVDAVDDPELLDLVELEVRELLTTLRVPGRRRAGGAGERAGGAQRRRRRAWTSILKLMEALDTLHAAAAAGGGQAVPDADRRRVLDLGARHGGDGARGAREGEGRARKSRLSGFKPTEKKVVTGRGDVPEAAGRGGGGGQHRGAAARAWRKTDVERGQVLAKPGSIKPHTKFKGEVYILSKEEGGRHTPFFNGYRPQFYIRTTDVTGSLKLPEGVEMVMPGDNTTITAELITPVALEKGARFAIREGGRTVGAGHDHGDSRVGLRQAQEPSR